MIRMKESLWDKWIPEFLKGQGKLYKKRYELK